MTRFLDIIGSFKKVKKSITTYQEREFSALVAFLEEYIRIPSQPDYERTKEYVQYN